MNIFEKMASGMSFETTFFIACICALTIYYHLKFTYTNAHKAPAILTTCGILGTFFGIALGLLDFNPNNVQESVPALIEGIKTAFWVSACGIGGALTVKLRESFYGHKAHAEEQIEGATIDDLARLLGDVKNALVGNEETSLIGQIKLARQDSNDRIDSLRHSLSAFYEKMSENNSKALIEALREVIVDFNVKISEQFGENFKHLNEAMGKILEWQNSYKIQMSEMILQQSETSKNISVTVENMGAAANNFEKMVTSAGNFSTISANLDTILSSLNAGVQEIETQRQQLQTSLLQLSQIIITASDGMPRIEEKIISITAQLDNSVTATSQKFQDMLLQQIQRSSDTLESNVAIASQSLTENLKNSDNELKNRLITSVTDVNREMNENIRRMNTEINTNIAAMIENTREQVVALDTALATELTRSLETLGRQLASLSNRFVDDYTPLTQRLREIVELARVA